MTHPHPKGNFVPKAVLMKSSLKTLNNVRQNSIKAALSVNTASQINTAFPRPTVNCAKPASNVFNRAHSHVRRPFNNFTTNKNSNFNEKVNTVKGNVTTVGPKAVVSDNKGNEANAVKPRIVGFEPESKKVLDHVSRHNGASMNFKRFDYIDAQGRSKHIIGNISYLTDYEDIDGGFVAFGGSTKGRKITRKEKIRTGKNCLKEKLNEDTLVGSSTNRKAFRVFNSRTRIVEENLHVKFSEDTPNIAGSGPNWLFDTDALTKSMNYEPVVAGNQSNEDACTKACDNVDPSFSSISKDSPDAGFKSLGEEEKKDYEDPWNEDSKIPSTEESRPNLEEIVYSDDDEDVGEEADMTNLDTHILMDVKSAFLYDKIEEEVYVCQPLGFEDPEFPDRDYKVEKALYGLHQAPRACYETLSTYLLDNGFQRGQIDKTLFIKRVKGDILLVKVYVDDIIFGSTRNVMCTEFEKMMHKKFQMSSMGER
ncbi:putative ribonuclease H-like domain-containing protein [Tanacetum coccineum]